MKSSLHNLIPFLPLLLNYSANCQFRRLLKFSAVTDNSGTQLNSNSSCLRSSLYSLRAVHTENTASSIVACWFTAAEKCLPHRCPAKSAARTTENTSLLLLHSFVSAGMCLPSRCLAINYSGFQASCHNIYKRLLEFTPLIPYGGMVEYLHHSPVSCRRRRKGNPVPGVITRPPGSWGT
jgi:hypothetical protein